MRVATMLSVAILGVSAAAFAQSTTRPGPDTTANNTVSNDTVVHNMMTMPDMMPGNTTGNSTHP